MSIKWLGLIDGPRADNISIAREHPLPNSHGVRARNAKISVGLRQHTACTLRTFKKTRSFRWQREYLHSYGSRVTNVPSRLLHTAQLCPASSRHMWVLLILDLTNMGLTPPISNSNTKRFDVGKFVHTYTIFRVATTPQQRDRQRFSAHLDSSRPNNLPLPSIHDAIRAINFTRHVGIYPNHTPFVVVKKPR